MRKVRRALRSGHRQRGLAGCGERLGARAAAVPGLDGGPDLLSFGTDVEVVSPAEVRDDLRATAAAVAASYGLSSTPAISDG